VTACEDPGCNWSLLSRDLAIESWWEGLDRYRWRAVVDTVMNSRVSTKCGRFLGQMRNCQLASSEFFSPLLPRRILEDLNPDFFVVKGPAAEATDAPQP
jgi:hypothetical protein